MKIFIDNVITEGQDKGELFIECHDDRNVELNIYRPNKEGKITSKNLGYFRTRNQALKECLKLEIHNTTITSINEWIKDNERLDKRIDEYICRVEQHDVELLEVTP